jgi:hypothetical protein
MMGRMGMMVGRTEVLLVLEQKAQHIHLIVNSILVHTVHIDLKLINLCLHKY